MCQTFPRVSTCNYYHYGKGGDEQKVNALCIMGLNQINDKVRSWLRLGNIGKGKRVSL